MSLCTSLCTHGTSFIYCGLSFKFRNYLVVSMVNSFSSQAHDDRLRWEHNVGSDIDMMRRQVVASKGESGASSRSLEQVLRAEIRVREKHYSESVEQSLERERSIDARARAAEASLRARLDGLENRLVSIEDRVNGALAGFRAQMETDIKTSTEGVAKLVLNLDGEVQMLSIRIDSADAERRSSLTQLQSVLRRIRHSAVSRSELQAATKNFLSSTVQTMNKMEARVADTFNSMLAAGLTAQTATRREALLALQKSLISRISEVRAGFDTKIQDVEMKAALAVDKERLLRVQGNEKFQSEATSAREKLRNDIVSLPVQIGAPRSKFNLQQASFSQRLALVTWT